MVSEVVSLSHWSGVMSLSSSVENNFRWGVFWVSFFTKVKREDCVFGFEVRDCLGGVLRVWCLLDRV
jgi:hypothetical protein